MKKVVICFLLLLFVVACPLSAQSLPDPPPLIILMNSSLWVWSGQPDAFPAPFTACHIPGEVVSANPVMSPDGSHIAYQAQPKLVTDVLAEIGEPGGILLLTDIWLCGIVPGGQPLTRIASQLADAAFMAGDTAITGHVRSQPAWSPDGTKLAWSEIIFPELTLQVIVYDLATATTQTIIPTNIAESIGPPAPLPIMWSNDGLTLVSIGLNGETFALEETYIVYDAAGNERARSTVGDLGDFDTISYRAIVQDAGQEYIGLLYSESGWQLLNSLSGEMLPAGGVVELFSPANPNGISLMMTINEEFAYRWTPAESDIVYPDTIDNFNDAMITLSPDGKFTFILRELDGVYVWDRGVSAHVNGTESTINGVSGVVWGSTAYRVRR